MRIGRQIGEADEVAVESSIQSSAKRARQRYASLGGRLKCAALKAPKEEAQRAYGSSGTIE